MTSPNSAGMVERPVSARDKERFRKIKQEMRTDPNTLFFWESTAARSKFRTTEKVILGEADIFFILAQIFKKAMNYRRRSPLSPHPSSVFRIGPESFFSQAGHSFSFPS
jgi:hypothetical protein